MFAIAYSQKQLKFGPVDKSMSLHTLDNEMGFSLKRKKKQRLL